MKITHTSVWVFLIEKWYNKIMKKVFSSLPNILILFLICSCARGGNKSEEVSSNMSSEQSSLISESITSSKELSSDVESTEEETSEASAETSSEALSSDAKSSEELSSEQLSSESDSSSESSSEQISSLDSSSEEISSSISESSDSEEYVLPPYVGGDLIFSEILIGDSVRDRAFEIANIGDEEICLNDYEVQIFRHGLIEGPSEHVALDGYIAPFETCVIAYPYANDDILGKANIVSESFLNDGTFPMTINEIRTNNIIDQIGYPGYYYDIGFHQDSVRKIEYLSNSDTYIPYGWVRYPNTDYSHLGNLDCLDNDTLFNGPKLTEEDFAKPYATDASVGSGGLIEVTYKYGIDGDTSKFDFGYSLSEFDIYGTMSLRYYGINTPEIAHGGNPADPYGEEAKAFTNSILSKCKHFLVQSVDGGSLTETYGRALGYLWVTYEQNPAISDYFLLNHLIIQNGYSNPAHVTRGGFADRMLYKGIAYVEYLFDANQYAIKEKLNIHSGE